MTARASLTTSLAAILVASSAFAAQDRSSIPFQLGDEAAMEAGCFAPCLCPVLIRSGLQGTFVLDPVESDGTFNHYVIHDVQWQFKSEQTTVTVTGSGTYKVAGDQQQLVLDLSVAGGESQHYDSGLTGGGSSFPHLRLPIALNGFHCHDSV